MKFEEQVASYYSKLRRRSRFFSSLMLVSGISLAAAAPFLSYEVSQIECVEKGSVVLQDGSEEVQTLKSELEGKEAIITKLESEVNGKNEELSNLASNPDCENLVRVIEDERDRLVAELTEATTGSTIKDETITELEQELADKDEQISELSSNPDCEDLVEVIKKDRDKINNELEGVKKERDELAANLSEVTAATWIKDKSISRLEESIRECEGRLNEINNADPDCGKFTEEINRLQQAITTKDRTINRLKVALEEAAACPSIKLSGTFHHNEIFSFGGNNFRVAVNSDDVGARYQLYWNNKNVTSRITYLLQVPTFTFNASGKRYQFSFNDLKGGKLPFSLKSL